MKKFLAVFLLSLTIALPAAFAEAADVPGFYQVGGKYLTFTGREDITGKGYRAYGYDCSVDLNENFAERYMQALTNNFNFRLIGHYVNDYRKTSATLYETWIFAYTGSKNVPTFQHKNIQDRKNPYHCHLVVGRSNNWQTDIRHFAIRVAYGLTYGED